MFMRQKISAVTNNANHSEGKASLSPLWTSTLAEVCGVLNIVANLQSQSPGPIFKHKRILMGETLYQIGESFQQMYVIKSGATKTVATTSAGSEQIIGFSLAGSLLGIDGIADRHHLNSVIALSDADIILLPMSVIKSLGLTCAGLSHGLYNAMALEIVKAQPATGRLGLTTRSRLGRLLVDLADQFGAMGYSNTQFNLPMARSDIASYLGMAEETVSRSFKELELTGLIKLDRRSIHILDRKGLCSIKRMHRRVGDGERTTNEHS